jgi:hypothetical protein
VDGVTKTTIFERNDSLNETYDGKTDTAPYDGLTIAVYFEKTPKNMWKKVNRHEILDTSGNILY